MRQLITRIDDDLHERLKARAASEGRSVNALVVEVLSAAAEQNEREALRARLSRRGRLVVPPQPAATDRAAALEATRGAGSAVSEALEAERSAR
jgi:plasmid stability protein